MSVCLCGRERGLLDILMLLNSIPLHRLIVDVPHCRIVLYSLPYIVDVPHYRIVLYSLPYIVDVPHCRIVLYSLYTLHSRCSTL